MVLNMSVHPRGQYTLQVAVCDAVPVVVFLRSRSRSYLRRRLSSRSSRFPILHKTKILLVFRAEHAVAAEEILGGTDAGGES